MFGCWSYAGSSSPASFGRGPTRRARQPETKIPGHRPARVLVDQQDTVVSRDRGRDCLQIASLKTGVIGLKFGTLPRLERLGPSVPPRFNEGSRPRFSLALVDDLLPHGCRHDDSIEGLAEQGELIHNGEVDQWRGVSDRLGL